MQLAMERVNSEAPRLTPEEADARAAALIAQYRNEKRGPRRGSASASSSASSSASWPKGLGSVVVYLAGVFGGAVWHAKPIIAVVIGVPLVLIARALLKRRATKETP